MGWRWERPGLALAREQDPEAEAKLAALEAAQREAALGLRHLLYLDELDLHLLPLIRARWMEGRRVRMHTPGTNRRHPFFGAPDARTDQWWFADHERKLAVYFVAFLQRLVAAYPDGPLSLVIDQAPAHTAKVVQAWLKANPRVTVLWLPTYAAHELKPAERIWGPTQVGGRCRPFSGHDRGTCGGSPPLLQGHRSIPCQTTNHCMIGKLPRGAARWLQSYAAAWRGNSLWPSWGVNTI